MSRISQKKATDRAVYERAKASDDPSMQAYVEWYENGREKRKKPPKPNFKKLSRLLSFIMENKSVDTVKDWSDGLLAKSTIWAIRSGRERAVRETTARTAFYRIRKAAREAGMDMEDFYRRG